MDSNMADHLQPKDADLPRANLMAPFGHLSNNSALTTTQPGHLDLATRPSIELGPRRQIRRLGYVKCDFCRRSKKKCEPSERQWPDEKCQRCSIKGFTCSAPTRNNRGISNESSVDNNSLLASTEQDLLHEQRAYCALAEKCIQKMRSGLKINICELSPTITSMGTVPDQVTLDWLPDELRYACRFWIHYLYRGKDRFLVDEDLQGKVYDFLTGYFLCWLEALSLLKLTDDGINSLEYLERLVNDATGGAKLRDFVRDAKQFILDHRSDVIQFPLKIYPNAERRVQSGSMKEIHIPKLQAWDSRSSEAWGTLVTILEGDHTSTFNDLTFSPDSKVLATPIDTTVKLWDVATQKTLRVLEHEGTVYAIAFSSDGNILASATGCSKDYGSGWMLNLWDSVSGKELQVENRIENADSVTSIAFSPDGKLLASASSREVSLWNPTTGLSLQTLQYDWGAAYVAFSPDGNLLASGCYDGEVKLWDPHIGCYVEAFMDHDHDVTAMAFSSDSQLLASASHDNKVKIWDLATGEVRQELTGDDEHLGIMSMAFAPGGQLVAFFSLDTLILWDLTTGEVRKRFYGHGDGYQCDIAFSPDGRLLACTAESIERFTDKRSVEIWEIHTAAN